MTHFPPEKNNRYVILGSVAIMLAAIFWSIDGLFIRPAFYTLPAGLIVFLEHFFGFIILSPFLFFHWKKIKMLSKKNWGAIFWISIFGGLLGTLMITKAFFAAVDGETTFATVIILQKLQPIFAILLARIILRERLPGTFYIWAIIAIIASYVIAFAKTGLSPEGIDWSHNAAIFAFLAAFSFGSSTVFGKRIANHLDFKAVAVLRFGITSILALIYIFINADLCRIGALTSIHWQLLALVVVTSGAGAMFIYYFGLRRVSASAATILELFWPFSALILDYLFNKNYLNTVQIIAFVILLIAFYQVVLSGKAKNMCFKAKVIHGAGRGKKLFGYPTANLDTTDLDIPHGIYVVKITIKRKEYQGLMHFGFKEVFSEPVSLEVLVKDFSGDMYDAEVFVEVVKKIRDVKNFGSPELLTEEVKNDLKFLDGVQK